MTQQHVTQLRFAEQLFSAGSFPRPQRVALNLLSSSNNTQKGAAQRQPLREITRVPCSQHLFNYEPLGKLGGSVTPHQVNASWQVTHIKLYSGFSLHECTALCANHLAGGIKEAHFNIP